MTKIMAGKYLPTKDVYCFYSDEINGQKVYYISLDENDKPCTFYNTKKKIYLNKDYVKSYEVLSEERGLFFTKDRKVSITWKDGNKTLLYLEPALFQSLESAMF